MAFFERHLLDKIDACLLAGDESVVTKAGNENYGWDYFFSGLLQKAVPSLSFFTLTLVSTKQRRSYPVRVEQTVRSEEEKASRQIKKQVQKVKSETPKRKQGRPKGSCNKKKAEKMRSPELERIQRMIRTLMDIIADQIHLTYLVLDGHFGNHRAF